MVSRDAHHHHTSKLSFNTYKNGKERKDNEMVLFLRMWAKMVFLGPMSRVRMVEDMIG